MKKLSDSSEQNKIINHSKATHIYTCTLGCYKLTERKPINTYKNMSGLNRNIEKLFFFLREKQYTLTGFHPLIKYKTVRDHRLYS